MENSALDIEPPSKFGGKKEVNKKKNGNNYPLIILLKNDRGKNKIIASARNLEKKVIYERQKNIIDCDYLKNDEYAVEENLTLTNKSVEFTKTSGSHFSQIIPDFHYEQKINNTDFTEKKPSNFYSMNSQYSFIPPIKEENKKEDLPAQIKEESKEIQYAIYNFDEAAAQQS
jgi:hypothetical protein